MAKFHVWHADPPNFLGDLEAARHWPMGYRFVARVEVDPKVEAGVLQLEQVFQLTNHIDHDWKTNPKVLMGTGLPSVRSTSVGDIIVSENGVDIWMVASFGFTLLAPRLEAQ